MTRQLKRAYLRIGLTGGIGSGKSTAADRFRHLGAKVYNADEISRRALDPGGACYARVLEAFGREILQQDGSIDRKRLAAIVFSNEEKRRALNGIVHPYVIKTMFDRAERDLSGQPDAIAVFEVPLLFESGIDRQMDQNVLVACGEETRVSRIMARDHTTREQALSRIRAQLPEDEKRSLADYILENDGAEEELFSRVDALYKSLTQRSNA